MRGRRLLGISVILFISFGVAGAASFGAPRQADPFLAQATPPPATVPNPGVPAPQLPLDGNSSTAQDLEKLRQMEADYLRAEMENNPALAGTVLAEDYVGIRADGTPTTRAEILQNLSAHRGAPAAYTIGAANMREYLFGDTACVTYTKIYTEAGRSENFRENLLHIFTKRKGVWRLQVSSPIPDQKASAAPKH